VSTNIDIHHLAAAYALDAVDPQERAAFEAHYPTCDVCRADVTEYRDALAVLAGASPAAPSPDVKTKVMAEIAQTRQLSPLLPEGVTSLAERRRRRRRAYGAVLAAAAALVLVIGGALVLRSGSEDSFASDVTDVMGAADSRMTTLDANAQGSVRVAWSADTGRAVVFGDDLAPAPEGQAYEVWLIDAAGAHAMNTLDPAHDGELRASFPVDAEPTSWGVTLEPAAGSPTPTGDLLFTGDA